MTKEKKLKSGLKILILISLIAIICFAVVISMSENTIEFNWDVLNLRSLVEKLHFENSVNQTETFDLGDLDITQTAEYDGNLLILTNYDIRLINSNGEEVWYFTHEIRHPVLNINGKWILVYEKTGKSYMVIKDGKAVIKDMLDEEIAFGEATDRYLLFITIGNNGYKRTISFISPETGVNLGALYIDDYYPYYIKALSNNNGFLLYGLGMNSTNISTVIRIYESAKKISPVANVEIEGLYPVMYSNNSNYFFVGENKAFCYDNNLDLVWSREYTDNITAAGLFEDSGAIVATNGETKMIKFYNPAGEEVKSIEAEHSIQNITVYKNTAAVIYGSKALFYDSSGRLIDNASLPGISLSVHFINNAQAFLVTEHEAVLYNISNK